jgi:hypothetical protein
MTYFQLFLIISLCSCDFHRDIELSIRNDPDSKFDSINVYIAAAKYSFKEIDAKELKTILQPKQSIKGGSDGAYFITTYKKGGSRNFNFGYYSNGYPLEDTIYLSIRDSSIIPKMSYRK